ncbi:MAG: hypothetical protein FJ276_27200, partial [Planctomycetes bacterium]|nr:hypothetical protein [Planctomycetota bacterium]
HAGAASPPTQPFLSGPVTADTPAQLVSFDVTGQKWLRLVSVVDHGAGNCHIWGEARLLAADGTETRLRDLKPVLTIVGWGELLSDRNWKDQPLTIGERQFAHGIWLHANSDICYALNGRYVRFEAWYGLDAARRQGQARFQVRCEGPNPLPGVWAALAKDYPLQSAEFVKDTGGHHLEWFTVGESTNGDSAVVRRALSPLGSGGDGLHRQHRALTDQRVPADDPQWLELYERIVRYRRCRAEFERIWIADVRRAWERSLDDLLEVPMESAEARWEASESRARRIAQRLPVDEPVDVAALRASIESLAAGMPGRFSGGEHLLERLEGRAARWEHVFASAAAGDEAAESQLAEVAGEVREFRRAILLAVDGMPEYFQQPAHAGLEEEWGRQYAALSRDLANRGHFETVSTTTYRRESLIAAEDRDPVDVVLRRTAALLADLRRKPAVAELEQLARSLAALRTAAAAIPLENSEARRALHADACRLRREIAFHNPLLDFDQILFIKRHRALFNHMCDQYYGMAATPGGGLFVLSQPFGSEPRVRDVLESATVQHGRLQGQRLSGGPNVPPAVSFDGEGNRRGEEGTGGSFLSPDLAYDGTQILFAYVECTGDMRHHHHVDPTRGHWDEGRCYHIFRVNADGSDLRQLTDGTFNDFDPCWLPNGRIAFISERRGGYLRCGRVCPTYTLFDMAADGTDITCLSFHETNEWHPSVTNDGRIVWTRWDYVDRHGCTAHVPWLTGLDGRDPRAMHGNFAPRQGRPDMEVDCRAIPGSHKFVATAAPHHGQAYGSLVIVDPHVADDDGMGPVRRFTPEVSFPETEGGGQVYGTPWPLSEDYHLCVYDAAMQPGGGFQGGAVLRGDYGIYLVDAFGNRELIYRDPEIGCLSPIPLRPRPMPAANSQLVKRGPETNPAARATAPGESTDRVGEMVVVNVYEGLKPWPEGTKITHLRVLQVLPMSVPSGRPPHETGLRVATAGDSVVPVRHVLGTVPVEADGSVFCTVPANKELFFQAVDERGLAVQSMRSATHVHEGDRLVCAGCHDRRHHVGEAQKSVPLALLREPSQLQPDLDGSNPFSYPRLVQPVLDRKCVECHAENADRAPNLAREPIARKWYASYGNLVERFGFHDYQDGYRTTPGQFGARASKLYDLLQKGHYDVQLTDEELHRLTLWLDCASMFYGVYEDEQGQA